MCSSQTEISFFLTTPITAATYINNIKSELFVPLKVILSTLRMAISLERSEGSQPGLTKASRVVISRWPSSLGFISSWAPMTTSNLLNPSAQWAAVRMYSSAIVIVVNGFQQTILLWFWISHVKRDSSLWRNTNDNFALWIHSNDVQQLIGST